MAGVGVDQSWASAEGGWQMVQGAFSDGIGPALVADTQGPAFMAHVLDSDVAIVEVVAPDTGAWSCVLDRRMARDYGFPEHLFKDPETVAAAAAAWAERVGLEPDQDALRQVLAADADPFVEELVFDLVRALGIALELPDGSADSGA